MIGNPLSDIAFFTTGVSWYNRSVRSTLEYSASRASYVNSGFLGIADAFISLCKFKSHVFIHCLRCVKGIVDMFAMGCFREYCLKCCLQCSHGRKIPVELMSFCH